MKALWILFGWLIVACATPDNQNERLARGMFDAFNQHDWDKMASYYSLNAEFLDPSFGNEYVSRTQDQTSSKYAQLQSVFPDIRDDIRELYTSGDKVIVEFVSSGSSGDSIHFELPIICVLTFQEGKIVRDATYYDQ